MTHSLRLGSAYADARPVVTTRPAVATYVAVNPVLRVMLYLFIFSIPFEMPRRTIPIEIPTLTAVLLLAATVLNPSAAFRSVPRPLLWFAAHVWLLALLWIVLANEQTALTMRHVLTLVMLLLLVWVVYNLLADPRVLRGVLLAIVLSCTARAAMQWLGIGATSYEVWTGGERVTLFGQNANLSAMILSAGLVTVLGLRVTRAYWLPRFDFVSWPLAALMGFAIIQTGSRGGLLCVAGGLLVFFLHGRTLGRRLLNVGVGLAAISLLTWGALQSEMMRGRILESTEGGKFAGREQIYPAAMAMIEERPLLGWGPIDNQFEIARRMQYQAAPRRDAHNLLLELMTTSGVLGTIPFLIGLGLCVRAAWRARRGLLGVLPLALLVAVLMGTVTGTWIASKILWMTLAFVLAAEAHWGAPVPERAGPVGRSGPEGWV